VPTCVLTNSNCHRSVLYYCICVRILLCVCVSSYDYMRAPILLCVSPVCSRTPTAIGCVSSCDYMCAPILLYVCPHTTICVLILLCLSSYYSTCVRILLYVCPHTTVEVSSYDYVCVLIRLYMWKNKTQMPGGIAQAFDGQRMLTYADVC
jgi:hypothetical protein